MQRLSILFLCWLFSINLAGTQSVSDLSKATKSFLETLNKVQKETAVYTFEDTSRQQWTNLPVGMAPRKGIRYGELSEESRICFHQILTTLMSSQGYLKTTSIMQLDDILNVVYQTLYDRKVINNETLENIRGLDWGYENYFIALWNEPDPDKPWGLKLEGHHISINFSVIDDRLSVTPLFFGTDPAEVQITKYAGIRVLSKEEDYGMQLINSLSEEQQKMAIISTEVPKDIITNPNGPKRLDEYQGIRAGDMTAKQQTLLIRLIEEYTHNMEHEKAHQAMEKIYDTGIEHIYFGWIGSKERHKPYYYIVNGPDFLIEYDNVGFQNDGNHIHSIWREKGADFGEDLLKAHYEKHKH